MSTIFLHSKRKSYYHRSNVPTKSSATVEAGWSIWRSLKTMDKAYVWSPAVRRWYAGDTPRLAIVLLMKRSSALSEQKEVHLCTSISQISQTFPR